MANVNGAGGPAVPTARRIYLAGLESDPAAQETLERAFFSSIRLRNATYKFTFERRLDDLNGLVESLLPVVRPLRIMDVAVSSGISSLEWAVSLEQRGIGHHLTAGDLTATAFLVSVTPHLHVLTDVTGYVLQFEVRNRPVPNPPGGRNTLRHWASLAYIRNVLRRRFADVAAACREFDAPLTVAGMTAQRVSLTSPRLRQKQNLLVVDDDIAVNQPHLNGAFDVLRAANILNHDYFGPDVLRGMVANLRSRLRSGGLFVVCRTHDNNLNHATVFRLGDDGRFTVAKRLNGGSEIESLVLELESARS